MRIPEQRHTKRCLAAAMICAVENARDDGGTSVDDDVTFRVWAQENRALQWADLYLAEGTATCTCPPIHPPRVIYHVRSLAPRLLDNDEVVDKITDNPTLVNCEHCREGMGLV